MLKKIFVCFFALFVLLSWFVNLHSATSQVDADQMLANAENDLVSAYISIAEAYRAGANVSKLFVKLGLAGALLAEANNAYRVGDHEKAYSLAMNCSETLNNGVYDALALTSMAEEDYSHRLLFNVVISSIGLSTLLVLSLFGWKFLKKRRHRQFLETKPEVEDEIGAF